MKIEENSVVRFHYTVSEPGQGQLESSREIEPLSILIGHGNIIPGLESAMKGHEAGDTFEVTVQPEEAYGERARGCPARAAQALQGAKLTPACRSSCPPTRDSAR